MREVEQFLETVQMPDGSTHEVVRVRYPNLKLVLADGTVIDGDTATPEQRAELDAYDARMFKVMNRGTIVRSVKL